MSDPGLRAIGGKRIAAAAAAAISLALGATYIHEGGYVNHPSDPGGATNLGVTEKVARDAGYTGPMRQLQKHCRESAPADVCADKIYLERYIEAPGYTPLFLLDGPVAAELFDTAVNMGPVRPSRWLQEEISANGGPKITADGQIGLQTIGAYVYLQVKLGEPEACRTMLAALDRRQRDEYDRLVKVNPRLKVFYRGWLNHRIGNVPSSRCGSPA